MQEGERRTTLKAFKDNYKVQLEAKLKGLYDDGLVATATKMRERMGEAREEKKPKKHDWSKYYNTGGN